MLSLLRSSRSLAAPGVSATRCLRCLFSHCSAAYSDISKITISGKLLRSPELGTTKSGRQCIRYTVRSWKGKKTGTNFYEFLCITDSARNIEFLTGLPAGSRVVAEGEFSPYQLAKQDGTKVQKYSIFANSLHVIEWGKSDEQVAGEDAQAQAAPAPEDAPEDTQDQAASAHEPAPEDAPEDAQDQAAPAPEPAPTEGGETPKHQA